MTVLKGKRGSVATCVSFGEVAERSGQRVTLCGRFLFWKSCAEKIQQNVAVERENQIVSIKKKFQSTNSLRRGEEAKSGRKSQPARQLAGLGWVRLFP